MAIQNSIPEIMVDYNVYNEGERFVGISGEVEIPALEAITSTVTGAGVLGEYETSAAGHFSSTEIEIPFRTITAEAVRLNEPRRQLLTFRASQQSYNRVQGRNEYNALKMVVAGKPKGMQPGKMIKSEQMEAAVTIEIEYIKIELDNVVLLELDKLNSVYIVNDIDYYQRVRDMI